MADEKTLSEQWQEFNAEYIDPAIDYLNPLRDINTEGLEKQGFINKWFLLAFVLFGIQPEKPTFAPGLLDWCFLGIPKIIFKLGEWLFCLATGEEGLQRIKLNQSWHMLWLWIPLLPIIAQGILTILLALVSFPLVGVVNWLYPFDQDYIDEAAEKGEEYKPGTVGRNRRRAFFNPSTWMFIGFVVPLAISFLIQGLASNGSIGAEILAQAAGPLLMIQTVFTGIAALMLVGAVLGLLHYAYQKLTYPQVEKPQRGNIAFDHTDESYAHALKEWEKLQPRSAVVEYLKELGAWMVARPEISIPLGIFCVGSVLAAVVLIIGYFTGFGYPGVFDFMLPVFNFIGTGFASGIQGLSSLPGLEFLGGLTAGPGLELASQIFTMFALVVGAIFTVDTVRRVTQTATEGGGPAGQEEDMKPKNEPAKGSPSIEQWKERKALFDQQKVDRENELKAQGFIKKYTVSPPDGTTGSWSFFYNYPVIPQGKVVYGKPKVDGGYRECASLIEKGDVLEVEKGWILDNELDGSRHIPLS